MRYLLAALLFVACGFVVFLGGSAAIGTFLYWAKGSGLSLREYETGGWVAIALLLGLLLRFGGMAFFGRDKHDDPATDDVTEHATQEATP